MFDVLFVFQSFSLLWSSIISKLPETDLSVVWSFVATAKDLLDSSKFSGFFKSLRCHRLHYVLALLMILNDAFSYILMNF